MRGSRRDCLRGALRPPPRVNDACWSAPSFAGSEAAPSDEALRPEVQAFKLRAEPQAFKLNRLFRLSELPQFTGLRRTQIGELMKASEFPRPIKLSGSGSAVAWLETDLVAWQTARIAARNSGDLQ